jgi:uncharacterized damage-inducible protein DinB
MAFADQFLPEYDSEMKTTRSLLERVPFDDPTWKPHAKSTNLGALASHVANLAGFGARITAGDVLDIEAPENANRARAVYNSVDEVLSVFDANVAQTREAIKALADADLAAKWTLRARDHVILSLPRAAALRTLMMNHIIHHRGQLSVYLRLNEVPLPSIYGPTADT